MTEGLMQLGANAVILGRRKDVISASAKKLEESTGSKCIGISADVRKPESLKAAVEEAVKAFGKIDFVICGCVVSSRAFNHEEWLTRSHEPDSIVPLETFSRTCAESLL
jgi:NADP-dependent 3-hydroxy acid dehydrogenase YdfG